MALLRPIKFSTTSQCRYPDPSSPKAHGTFGNPLWLEVEGNLKPQRLNSFEAHPGFDHLLCLDSINSVGGNATHRLSLKSNLTEGSVQKTVADQPRTPDFP